MSLATRLFPTGRGATIHGGPVRCCHCGASDRLREDHVQVGEYRERVIVGWEKFCGSCGTTNWSGHIPAREFIWLMSVASVFKGGVTLKNDEEFPLRLTSCSDDKLIWEMAVWVNQHAREGMYSGLAVIGGVQSLADALKELRQAMADEWADQIQDTVEVPAVGKNNQFQLFE